MKVWETPRLRLRWLRTDDEGFILRLLNEPAWLRYIGDKDVKTMESARRYIENGPMEMYARLGFGLYLVELKETGEPIGICGLLKRESLADVDLGFALLQSHQGKGFAFESASAVMSLGTRQFGLSRMVAVTTPDNVASERLLRKLGFRFERLTQLVSGGAEVKLYVND